MKKSMLVLGAMLCFGLALHAQTSYGLKAGLNLSKMNGLDKDEKEGQKSLPSFYVTGYADIPVASQFSVQPGISLQGKGEKFKFDDEEFSANVMSVEIPINAVYSIPAGPGNVFLGAGPYVGINISGKYKIGKESEKMKFTGDEKDMKMIDAGLNLLGGYKLSNGFLLNVGYGLGLMNLMPEGDTSRSMRTFSFGIGYQF